MKKILLSLAVAFVSLAASAQVYVGGSVGIASSKTDGSDAVTTYQFLPEVGYNGSVLKPSCKPTLLSTQFHKPI